jgi:magnesium-transporting ATPase (P-type)
MWYSLVPLVGIQVLITYVPGLNNILFGMTGMDGVQWGLTIGSMVITFLVMETEKCIRSGLKAKGADTDDRD